MADAGYFVWLVFIACARRIRPSSHLLSIFLLVRARVLEISPLAPKNPAPATNANLSYTQVRIHKPALGKVWGLAMLSSNEERGTGTSTANWKIKNGNKTNPNHYPFSVFVPFFIIIIIFLFLVAALSPFPLFPVTLPPWNWGDLPSSKTYQSCNWCKTLPLVLWLTPRSSIMLLQYYVSYGGPQLRVSWKYRMSHFCTRLLVDLRLLT